MSIKLECKLETEKDNQIFNVCSKLLENYNTITNQKLSYTFKKGYFMLPSDKNIVDNIDIFWNLKYHTILMIDEKLGESYLINYFIKFLTQRVKEIVNFDKDNQDDVFYVANLYKLISGLDVSYIFSYEQNKYFKECQYNLKKDFEIHYSSWL